MKNIDLFIKSIALFVAGLIFVASIGIHAQEDGNANSAEELSVPDIPNRKLPKIWNDRIFNRHVSIKLLGVAIDKQKPEMLADMAMEFMEAERVLKRSHRAVTAERLFLLALKAAADSQDKNTVERLARVADEVKNQKLVQLVANSTKLASKARGGDSGSLIDVAKGSSETIARYVGLLKQLEQAEFIPSKLQLTRLKRDVEDGDYQLDDKKSEYVMNRIAAALDIADKADNTSNDLALLASVTRDDFDFIGGSPFDGDAGTGTTPVGMPPHVQNYWRGKWKGYYPNGNYYEWNLLGNGTGTQTKYRPDGTRIGSPSNFEWNALAIPSSGGAATFSMTTSSSPHTKVPGQASVRTAVSIRLPTTSSQTFTLEKLLP